ncbi:hypothetical protein GGX14DRAFT_672774 [Mycena pura]|uniref:Uncharacterized protein n=1 Tax=Mycena pura TaxID=153505 RepID=A0AAD6V0N6_9AGAR|nr:hypothetical protein GGX14DRAFT_672774 [Mycena pura]
MPLFSSSNPNNSNKACTLRPLTELEKRHGAPELDSADYAASVPNTQDPYLSNPNDNNTGTVGMGDPGLGNPGGGHRQHRGADTYNPGSDGMMSDPAYGMGTGIPGAGAGAGMGTGGIPNVGHGHQTGAHTGGGAGTGIGAGAGAGMGTGGIPPTNAVNVGHGHHTGGGALTGKIEHAIGTIVGSQSLKAKGLQKEQEARALKVQSSELAEAERLEQIAATRRERAVAHGAHPDNRHVGGLGHGDRAPGPYN